MWIWTWTWTWMCTRINCWFRFRKHAQVQAWRCSRTWTYMWTYTDLLRIYSQQMSEVQKDRTLKWLRQCPDPRCRVAWHAYGWAAVQNECSVDRTGAWPFGSGGSGKHFLTWCVSWLIINQSNKWSKVVYHIHTKTRSCTWPHHFAIRVTIAFPLCNQVLILVLILVFIAFTKQN